MTVTTSLTSGVGVSLSLIIRDLDDETMLKMMAADNDDAYNLTPAFILETVAAANVFVVKGSKGYVTPTSPTKGPDLHDRIATLLAWPPERIKYAFAQLHAIESGELSKKAVESLPTIHAATVLHRPFPLPALPRELIGVPVEIEAALRIYARSFPEDAAGIEGVIEFRRQVGEEFEKLRFLKSG